MRHIDPEQLKSQEILARDLQAEDYCEYCHRSLGPYGDRGQVRLVLQSAGLRPHFNVLDAGCGVGRFSLPMCTRVRSICSVDYSARSIDILQRKLRERGITNILTQVGDLTRVGLPESYFDAAISPGVIHHIPRDELRVQALQNILNALRPGARFVMLVYRWRGNIRPPMPKEGMHASKIYYYAFTAAEARDLMRRAGYNNIRVRGFLSLPRRFTLRMPGWMEGLEPLLAWFPTSVLRAHSLLITASRPLHI